MSLLGYFDFEAGENIESKEWMFKTPSQALWTVKEEWIVDYEDPRQEDQTDEDKELYHKITITTTETKSYFAVVNIFNEDPKIDNDPLESRIDFHHTHTMRHKFSLYKERFFREELPIKLCCSINLYPIFHSGYVPSTCLSNPEICQDVPFAKFASVEAKKNLSRDLESLLEKGTYSDMSLVCEATELKVHKNILELRAPSFMMNVKSEEMENKKINVDDMDLVVLRQMLSFVYTGKVTSKDASVMRCLCTVADCYNMEEMEEMCDKLLHEFELCESL